MDFQTVSPLFLAYIECIVRSTVVVFRGNHVCASTMTGDDTVSVATEQFGGKCKLKSVML